MVYPQSALCLPSESFFVFSTLEMAARERRFAIGTRDRLCRRSATPGTRIADLDEAR